MNEFKGNAIWVGYGLAILACLIVIGPFAWIFLNSIKTQIDIFTGTLNFTPTAMNYDSVLFGRRSDFLLNVQNSMVVALVSTALVIVVGTLAAYSFSRFRWARLVSGVFLGWTLIFHMIPTITLVGPWFITFRQLGLFDTLTGAMQEQD